VTVGPGRQELAALLIGPAGSKVNLVFGRDAGQMGAAAGRPPPEMQKFIDVSVVRGAVGASQLSRPDAAGAAGGKDWQPATAKGRAVAEAASDVDFTFSAGAAGGLFSTPPRSGAVGAGHVARAQQPSREREPPNVRAPLAPPCTLGRGIIPRLIPPCTRSGSIAFQSRYHTSTEELQECCAPRAPHAEGVRRRCSCLLPDGSRRSRRPRLLRSRAAAAPPRQAPPRHRCSRHSLRALLTRLGSGIARLLMRPMAGAARLLAWVDVGGRGGRRTLRVGTLRWMILPNDGPETGERGSAVHRSCATPSAVTQRCQTHR
jgi:hypothetical protein